MRMMLTTGQLKKEVFFDDYFTLEYQENSKNIVVLKDGQELATLVLMPYENNYLFIENPESNAKKSLDVHSYLLMKKDTYENELSENQNELNEVMDKLSLHSQLTAQELEASQERMNYLIQTIIVLKGKLKENQEKIQTENQFGRIDEFKNELKSRIERIQEVDCSSESKECENKHSEPSVASLNLLKSMSNKEGISRLISSDNKDAISLKDVLKVMSGGILRPQEAQKMENVFIKKVDQELEKILNNIYK